MKERIYIKDELKETFKNLRCGIVDYIDIYRVEDGKAYFQAGTGKFHMTLQEIEEARLS
jgi:hypothetical protein